VLKRKKIIIVGGGTAGWITALYIRQSMPNVDVTVIQSSKIGIIGVGEATTPQIIEFLNFVGIAIDEVITKSGGTIKNGINFVNWNGDGKSYFHPFADLNQNLFHLKTSGIGIPFHWYLINSYNKGHDLDNCVLTSYLALKNKTIPSEHSYALHFDAKEFAKLLETKGGERGIHIIDGEVKNIKEDVDGYIEKIVLEDGREVNCDFVFDCTGNSKLFIGKHYKQKWISYKEHLPMKKAIPFWLDKEEKIRPYTTATAMKYGWVWNIPLQHRIGSGYVFDSDYIDENQALEEAESLYGRKLEIRKILDFDPGRFENVWVKNCMAIGLSSSFVEPLESTSIMGTIAQLHFILLHRNDFFRPSQKTLDKFNEGFKHNMDKILNFIYLHYITKRNDSEFWKNIKNKTTVPPTLIPFLEDIENSLFFPSTIENKVGNLVFSENSYIAVSAGLGLLEQGLKLDLFGEEIAPSLEEYQSMILSKTSQTPSYSKMLHNKGNT